jgi:L-aspartate oxidase
MILSSPLLRSMPSRVVVTTHPNRLFSVTKSIWLRSSSTQSTSIIHKQEQEQQQDHDNKRLIVVGSGVAGCSTALIAAELYKIPVTVVFAGSLPTDCNSYWAQGGIIYRNYDPQAGDSPESLSADIHRAGAGLCQDDAVWKVAKEGPSRVRQLLLNNAEKGRENNATITQDESSDKNSNKVFASVPFDVNPTTGKLSLCLEASHAAARILHNADHTGATITNHITQAAAKHPLITFQPHTVVTDLITTPLPTAISTNDNNNTSNGANQNVCIGIQTMNRYSGIINPPMYTSAGVVLASGGLAGIYQHTTNPAGYNALGSSVALAIRAGAQTQDLEYVQFHPTALCIPGEARFLLTEALRGEGAILRDSSGRAFAKEYHPDGELAPRDIVARAVFSESQKVTNENNNTQYAGHNAFLDITHRDTDWLHKRFPTIQQHLQQHGLDLGKDKLPVIPAAHYTCGGITTDLQGRTSLLGLYAAGEAARTGLHGGNRLASTSLLEGLVFGSAVADYVGSETGRSLATDIEQVLLSRTTYKDDVFPSRTIASQYSPFPSGNNSEQTNVPPHYQEPQHMEKASHRAMQLLTLVRRVMWDYVGVVRTPNGLRAAIEMLHEIQQQAYMLHSQVPTLETAAVRDAATAGYAVASAAIVNTKSVGAHCIVEDATPFVDDEELTDEEDAVAEMRC